jgi:hypothetical protein
MNWEEGFTGIARGLFLVNVILDILDILERSEGSDPRGAQHKIAAAAVENHAFPFDLLT